MVCDALIGANVRVIGCCGRFNWATSIPPTNLRSFNYEPKSVFDEITVHDDDDDDYDDDDDADLNVDDGFDDDDDDGGGGGGGGDSGGVGKGGDDDVGGDNVNDDECIVSKSYWRVWVGSGRISGFMGGLWWVRE
jgi:hypothetical protein